MGKFLPLYGCICGRRVVERVSYGPHNYEAAQLLVETQPWLRVTALDSDILYGSKKTN
jgi:hypothetical protein